MDLCPATFRSFVVQWSAKIASRRPQLKPLKRGDKYHSGNKNLEIVLTITRVIATIVINVGHQVIWCVDVTHHHRETKCNYLCYVPTSR